MRHHIQRISFATAIVLAQSSPAAFATDLESMFDLDTVSIVSGYEQDVNRAPAISRVITKEEIQRLGLINLGQVLERVGGIHVSPSSDAIATVISSRGVTTRMLLMYDGVEVPVGSVNSHGSVRNIPLFDVEYIEIMRGPNSAVFGADALLGAINIVTQTASGKSDRVGLVAGDNGSWGLYGSTSAEVLGRRLSLYASHYETDGTDPLVEIDRQSVIDAQLGTSVSLAPGAASERRTLQEFRAAYQISDALKFKAEYYTQKDLGNGAGYFQALDPANETQFEATTVSFNYKKSYGETDVVADLVYYNTEGGGSGILLPAGTLGGLFPDGVRQRLLSSEDRYKVAASIVRKFGNHKIRAGLNYYDSKQDNPIDTRNFLLVDVSSIPIPTGADIEYGGTEFESFRDLDSTLKSVYISDEWAVSNDWTIGVGYRLDDYSTVGSTTNPRLSLIWNRSLNTTYKLLYGEAFRPPSATELSSNGFFIAAGNRDLEPAVLKMTEFIAEHQITPSLKSILSLYDYEIEDLVQQTPNPNSPSGFQFTNGDEQSGKGLEWNLQWEYSDRLRFNANFALTDNDELTESSERNRYIAEQLYKLDVNYLLNNDWSVSGFLQHVSGRSRSSQDARPDPEDYNLLGLSFSKQNLMHGLDLAINIQNVFDADAREPISNAIPLDYPVKERTFYINLSRNF